MQDEKIYKRMENKSKIIKDESRRKAKQALSIVKKYEEEQEDLVVVKIDERTRKIMKKDKAKRKRFINYSKIKH